MKENLKNHDIKDNEFNQFSEAYFLNNDFEFNFSKLCDMFKEIVNAKYCILDLYAMDENCYTTVAMSGLSEGLLKINKVFGFNLMHKKWPNKPELQDNSIYNKFVKCSLYDLYKANISIAKINLLMKQLCLKETYLMKIKKDDTLIGQFIFMLDSNETIQNESEAITFVGFLSAVLIQEQTNLKLNKSEKIIFDGIYYLPDATFAIDLNHNVMVWNEAIEQMTGIKSIDIVGKSSDACTIPFFGESRPHLIDLLINPKDGIKNKYEDISRDGYSISAQIFAKKLNHGKGAWVYVIARPLLDKNNKIIGYIETIRDITRQKQVEIQLKKSEENFINLFKRAPLGYLSLDENGRFIEVNDAWLKILGYKNSEVIGKLFKDFLYEEEVDSFLENFTTSQKKRDIHIAFYMKHKNGDLKYIEFNCRNGYKIDGSFDKTHCIIQDITEKKLFDEELIESEQTYKALFEFSGVGIGFYTIDGYVISYNPKAAQNLGGTCENFAGKYIYDLFPKENADIYLRRIFDVAQANQPHDYEDKVELSLGTVWFFSTYSPINDINGKVRGVQIISQDISDLKIKEEKIAFLSYHDQLTSLYNRRYFDEELLRLDTQRNYPLTLLLGDVNGLKLINDSFGHTAGDELLIRIARSIKLGCRQDDVIARVGGDEFSIILPKTNASEAEMIIQRINKYVSLEKVGPIEISISFGFDTKHTNDETMDAISKKAEDNMYRHKLNDSSSLRNKTINIIMSTLFEKNKREMDHSERVSQISVEIAIAMGFVKDDINRIRTAGLLHDIGKIGIDESILNSKTFLSNEEWKEIKKHTEIGYRILSSAPEFSDIADDVLSHHERWDGNGYPRGIKGELISIFARIITIADAYDAMISERPYRTYRKSMSIKDAIIEIRKNAGTQFDLKVARVFVEIVMHFPW